MIINFGSINIDHVYKVSHLPVAGETLAVQGYEQFLGGKGVNQSIAIHKSGGNVHHVGQVGPDGDWALEKMTHYGVATELVKKVETPTGHAIVMVDEEGENQILVHGGANLELAETQIEAALDMETDKNSWFLLQNEMVNSSAVVDAARARGFKIAYSAAPFVAEDTLPLMDKIDLLIVNNVERSQLASHLNCEEENLPVKSVLTTFGAKGSTLRSNGEIYQQEAFQVNAVDTTGAGDCFLGAFLARLTCNDSVEDALRFASASSALQVTRNGAADAIPDKQQVIDFLKGVKN